MAGDRDMNFNLRIDRRTERYFQRNLPEKLALAKKRAVEAMGKVWADETKELTRDEGHIKTGLFVNSIGYKTGSPATDDDVIHEIVDQNGKIILKTGSNVAYAGYLENKFNLMARGLDISKERMGNVAKIQIKETLFR